jgi:hypothetical protein
MSSKKILSHKNIYPQIESHIPPEAWQSTVAIVIVCGTELRQFGTGTLFRVADQSFIVTAGHVIKDANKSQNDLCITCSNGSFVQVHGIWMCSAEGQYGTTKDPFDVALLPLDSTIVAKLSDKSFLRLDDVCLIDDLSNGMFCLFGYPALWSQNSINTDQYLLLKPFQYTTYAFDGSTEALDGYQSRFHLLLSADLLGSTDIDGRQIKFRSRHGLPARFPGDLGGISGCSIWMIGDVKRPIQEWKKERPKIVAVQTGVFNDLGIIKTTRWVAVSTLMYEAFPELRSSIMLWRG